VAFSMFHAAIDAEEDASIQLKYHHNRINGSDLWVSLGATVNSPAAWRRLLQNKPEIVEIGIFLVETPTETVVKQIYESTKIRFYISKTSKGDTGAFKGSLDTTPKDYTVST